MQTRFQRTALAAVIGAGACFVAPASFALMFDQNVTPDVIFGSGNANGSFTVDQSNGIELGLRGKLRHNAAGAPENTFNSNGDGTYSFDAGVAPTQPSPTAVWSFEWSINSDWDDTNSTGLNLAAFTYALGLDLDPSLGTSFISFDPINDLNPATSAIQWDHAIGDNTTGNGGGTSIANGASDAAGYANLLTNNNVAQNSWKAHWFFGPGFDPTLDATYDIYLAAFDSSGAEAARSSIQIIVGNGGSAPVPEPATLALASTALLGLALRRRRRG